MDPLSIAEESWKYLEEEEREAEKKKKKKKTKKKKKDKEQGASKEAPWLGFDSQRSVVTQAFAIHIFHTL